MGDTEGVDRHGELTVEDSNGTKYTIKIIATHQYPIPEDTYALLGNYLNPHKYPKDIQYWAVGRRLPGRRFEKLSVFRITDWDEMVRLESLSVAKDVEIVLE